MELGNLQRRYVDFASSLFREGFLDNQFTQLQQLQDESNPEFVLEVVTLFFEDSEKLLNELSRTLDQQVVDFRSVDAHVHQLKGSSASIGAQRVKNVCIAFRNYCEEMNQEGSVLQSLNLNPSSRAPSLSSTCIRSQQERVKLLLQVPPLSAGSEARVPTGEGQIGSSVQAGAADSGCWWINPNDVVGRRGERGGGIMLFVCCHAVCLLYLLKSPLAH